VAPTNRLSLNVIVAPSGYIGDAYDGALMETPNGLYKSEWVANTAFHDGLHNTIAEAEFASAGWIDW
jgi:hypothetical protein